MADEEGFTLYSDNASHLRHIKRQLALLWVFTLLNFSVFVLNITLYCGEMGMLISLIMGCINGLLCIPLIHGLVKLYRMRSRLTKDQKLFE